VIRRVDAAQLPLCLLTPEMRECSLVDQVFATAGTAIEGFEPAVLEVCNAAILLKNSL
jgi:hypothetical protein